jgi:hypothetical protein
VSNAGRGVHRLTLLFDSWPTEVRDDLKAASIQVLRRAGFAGGSSRRRALLVAGNDAKAWATLAEFLDRLGSLNGKAIC